MFRPGQSFQEVLNRRQYQYVLLVTVVGTHSRFSPPKYLGRKCGVTRAAAQVPNKSCS
nr:putative integron gene cassette protein [uncultured bacterium]